VQTGLEAAGNAAKAGMGAGGRKRTSAMLLSFAAKLRRYGTIVAGEGLRRTPSMACDMDCTAPTDCTQGGQRAGRRSRKVACTWNSAEYTMGGRGAFKSMSSAFRQYQSQLLSAGLQGDKSRAVTSVWWDETATEEQCRKHNHRIRRKMSYTEETTGTVARSNPLHVAYRESARRRSGVYGCPRTATPR
jgi:hypothetical protein